MYDTIIRILLGTLVGALCAIVPLILGFILNKTGGGVLGAFVCVICGGLFGFLQKSNVLTVIVMIIVLLFLTLDKSKPTTNKQQASSKNSNTTPDAASSDSEKVTPDAATIENKD